MSLSKESVEEFQRIFKEQYGKEMSYEEAYESGMNLVGLFEVLLKGKAEEMKRKEKLKGNPKGYELENAGGRSCMICRQSPNPLWYDRFGQKCMTCQRAVESGDVPGYVCENRDAWYSMYDLESKLKIKSATARKLERNGVLTARKVKAENGAVCTYLFLLQDNKGVLPSKKLLKGSTARVSEDSDRYTNVDWYEWQDPKEVLVNYSILEHLTAFDDWKPKYFLKNSKDAK